VVDLPVPVLPSNKIISLLNNKPIKCLILPQDHHEERIEGNGGNKKGSSSF